jgi:Lon protease-like protein
MICPFEPSEKQALLEAGDLKLRAELMATLIEMALLDHKGSDAARH